MNQFRKHISATQAQKDKFYRHILDYEMVFLLYCFNYFVKQEIGKIQVQGLVVGVWHSISVHLNPISDIRCYKQILGGQRAVAVSILVVLRRRKYLTYRNIEGGGVTCSGHWTSNMGNPSRTRRVLDMGYPLRNISDIAAVHFKCLRERHELYSLFFFYQSGVEV